jgi:hypothetical protein
MNRATSNLIFHVPVLYIPGCLISIPSSLVFSPLLPGLLSEFQNLCYTRAAPCLQAQLTLILHFKPLKKFSRSKGLSCNKILESSCYYTLLSCIVIAQGNINPRNKHFSIRNERL